MDPRDRPAADVEQFDLDIGEGKIANQLEDIVLVPRPVILSAEIVIDRIVAEAAASGR